MGTLMNEWQNPLFFPPFVLIGLVHVHNDIWGVGAMIQYKTSEKTNGWLKFLVKADHCLHKQEYILMIWICQCWDPITCLIRSTVDVLWLFIVPPQHWGKGPPQCLTLIGVTSLQGGCLTSVTWEPSWCKWNEGQDYQKPFLQLWTLA
jgi:hypothetical protein